MTKKYFTKGTSIAYWIIGFIFLVLFVIPVFFTRIDDKISWLYVTKIWKDQFLLLPLFAINHWLFVPNILFRKRYLLYWLCIVGLITLFTVSYYYNDEVLNKKPITRNDSGMKRPEPIPPYAHLFMYSLLIVGVDTGLLFTGKWNENEEERHILEKKNIEMQLDMLRNQVSPHFFMNTLNNIYALIDCNTPKAKEAVMKLSKLMRYMLYENEHGKVKISKEFEFITSYIDLMKLRYADDVSIRLIFPEELGNMEIPPMLFICYIENAFKHGVSYQQDSFINIIFEKRENKLHFSATNSKQPETVKHPVGGLGLQNNENRLKLLYADNYSLTINSSDKIFNVSLEIPLT